MKEIKYKHRINTFFILIFLIPILIFLISGCSFTSSKNKFIEIKDAKYELNDLIVTLNANLAIKNVRIENINDGNILCTKYFDLEEGENQIKLTDCGFEEKITISAFNPGGTLIVKEFTLTLPLFKLKKGFRYDYSVSNSGSSTWNDVSIYITKESKDLLEGIIGIKDNQQAYLLKFKINNNDLTMQATYPLSQEQLTLKNIEYENAKEIVNKGIYGNSLLPFFLIVFKESSDFNLTELLNKKTTTVKQASSSDTITFKIESEEIVDDFLIYKILIINNKEKEEKTMSELYTSTFKPYHLMKLLILEAGPGGVIFEGSEKKDFNLADYDGYTIQSMQQSSEEGQSIPKAPIEPPTEEQPTEEPST